MANQPEIRNRKGMFNPMTGNTGDIWVSKTLHSKVSFHIKKDTNKAGEDSRSS